MNNRKFITTSIFIFSFVLTAWSQQGRVQIVQDSIIPQLLELKTEMTQSNRLGDRYVVQIYAGNNGKASEAIEEFRSIYTEWPSTVVYETPNYKVWVGRFRNSLEADRALLRIREEFPAAFRLRPSRR